MEKLTPIVVVVVKEEEEGGGGGGYICMLAWCVCLAVQRS